MPPPGAQNGGSKIFAPGIGSVGSYGAMTLANKAISTNGTRIASGSSGQSRPMRSRFSPALIVRTAERVGWRVVMDMLPSREMLPGEPDARIDVGVQHVDDQVDQHDHHPRQHHDALHQREIA